MASSVKLATARKWGEELDPSGEWLELEAEGKLAVKMKCTLCASYVDSLKYCRNFSRAFVDGVNKMKKDAAAKHLQSEMHRNAMGLRAKPATINDFFAKARIGQSIRGASGAETKRVERLVEVAYMVCKTESPFTMFPHICHLMKRQGVDRGSAYLTDKKAAEFASCIAEGGSHGGQLTNVGMRQAYHLGQSFRKLYLDRLHFLTLDLSLNDIYIRSTNINRCIETAKCFVAGMFGVQVKSNNTEPVKVHVDHAHTEVLYPQGDLHPVLKDKWRQAKHEHHHIPGMAQLAARARELLGLPEDAKVDMTHIKDDLSTRMVHGFDLPPQFDDEFIEELSQLSPKVLQHAMGGSPGEELKHVPIAAGPLLHLIQKLLHELKDNHLKEKMHLYFCHDTTLTALLIALGIFDDDWPPLCSNITLEIYQHTDRRYFIRVLYRGQVQKIFQRSKEIILVDDVIDSLRPLSMSWEDFIHSGKTA